MIEPQVSLGPYATEFAERAVKLGAEVNRLMPLIQGYCFVIGKGSHASSQAVYDCTRYGLDVVKLLRVVTELLLLIQDLNALSQQGKG